MPYPFLLILFKLAYVINLHVIVWKYIYQLRLVLMNDDRWGDYIPWFFRHSGGINTGDFNTFFLRIGQRLERLFKFNEAEIANIEYFGACLESETLQRFQHLSGSPLDSQVKAFFDPELIRSEVRKSMSNDRDEIALQQLERKSIYEGFHKLATQLSTSVTNGTSLIEQKPTDLEKQIAAARNIVQSTYNDRFAKHFNICIHGRLGVLEALIRMLPEHGPARGELISDSLKFFAEAKVPLIIRGNPPLIVPFEDTLLEHEVIGKLLPRLEAKFPQRAQEFIRTYHALISEGNTLDSIFSEAFKTLEEVAREATGNRNFLFDQSNLNSYFPNLHATTKKTLINLAAHRGDKAGHGRSSPKPEEIRYLLFQILNISLLIIDYQDAK